VEARPGRDLQVTLDLELQQVAARYFQERVGAAVALDPRNGEILALVSSPAFEPNLFARRLKSSEWAQILESPHHPLQNRALKSEYSPGSIFKIVIAVAGLNDRVVDEKERVFCRGSTRIYDRRFRCWKRGGHGWVNLRKAIKESCDVYFYQLGQKLGISRIAHYARLFGLGTTSGLDVNGENEGLVPDPEWSQRARGEPWYPGETISVAIGQGPLLVTPLQIASLMATIANGGRRVVPHVELAVRTAVGETVDVAPHVLETVREALWAVVNERGTGASSRLADFDIAGKTGTAQVVEQKTWIDSKDLPFAKRDHAWFASFGPFEAPELVVVVFVEHGGKGSVAAAPLARQVYEKYFGNRRKPEQPA
jgi:penicillin-binding protein 2